MDNQHDCRGWHSDVALGKEAAAHKNNYTTHSLKKGMAGVVGFEPTHAGIRIRCLNHLATPQQYTPNDLVERIAREGAYSNALRAKNKPLQKLKQPRSARRSY